MSEIRRRHDPECREGVVLTVLESRKPIAHVARDPGIDEGTPGN